MLKACKALLLPECLQGKWSLVSVSCRATSKRVRLWSTEAQCGSISVISGRSGSQQVLWRAGCCSGPPSCIMGGIYYWRAPLTPLPSSAVVICVSSMYLLFLLYLSTVSASVLHCLLCHLHTRAHLTQQLISIPNLLGERENEFRGSIVSLHGCVYQYLYIDLALPLLLHSSRYRLVFPAGIWAYNLTDGRSAWGRVYRTGVSHMPLECVRPLSKKNRGEGGGVHSMSDAVERHFYQCMNQCSGKDEYLVAYFEYSADSRNADSASVFYYICI